VVVLGVVAILAVASSTICWIEYLRFCRWLVAQEKDASCLRDAAVAARAFRAPAAVAQVLAKLVGLMRRSGGS
jgi:hypothetical protein